ncbi:hypothetical protein E2C01_036304 [Portunus trituberculatus]|uniref:Uncharacterized protein n=1 Tax=Portunus trituberculatus TaxID=210409 RepID=A0A5B7FAV0_PORTR|nr:hypothetical protein [Portunus trituberculatus]
MKGKYHDHKAGLNFRAGQNNRAPDTEILDSEEKAAVVTRAATSGMQAARESVAACPVSASKAHRVGVQSGASLVFS